MDNHQLKNHFRKGLHEFVESNQDQRIASAEIGAFFPLSGNLFDKNRELMVIGRATNGWLHNPYSVNSLGNSNEFEKMWKELFHYEFPDDPIALVWEYWNRETYPFWRSAFHRVAKKVLLELNVTTENDEQWASHMMWSNLYKIAPYQGGNPGARLCQAQEPWCYDLLKKEIEIYQPKRVLFMTGLGWAQPFFDHIGFAPMKNEEIENVRAFGKAKIGGENFINIVVTRHPQGKPEQEIVDRSATLFNKLM